jgi:heptosyltransferase-3
MSASTSLRCLFIKPKLIGDTLLLTPTLQAVRKRHPDAIIDVLVRHGCESILDGCTAPNRVLLTAPPDTDGKQRSWSSQWAGIRELRRESYDWIFECSDTARGRYAARLARGRRRVYNRQELETHGGALERMLWPVLFSDGVRFEWRKHHAVEGSYLLARDFLGLPATPPPLDYRPVAFDPAGAGFSTLPAGFRLSPSRLVVHGGTRLPSKAWPADRWAGLITALAPRFDQIFLSTGPSVEEARHAHRLAALAPGKAFCPAGPLPWNQLAALLQGARLFVGVDTAAMHLAAACRCPSLVIWGPTSAIIFGPQSGQSAIVLDDRVVRPPYQPTEAHDEARLASRNSLAAVQRAARQLLDLPPA